MPICRAREGEPTEPIFIALLGICPSGRVKRRPIQVPGDAEIEDRVADEAYNEGYDCWALFDADEVMVAHWEISVKEKDVDLVSILR